MVDANKQYSQIQNEMNQINEHTLQRIYLNYKKSNEKEKQKSKGRQNNFILYNIVNYGI